MKVLLLLFIISFTNAKVYLYKYPTQTLDINGIKIRETLHSSYFASQNNYNFQTIEPIIYDTDLYFQGSSLLKDYHDASRIGRIQYTFDKKHTFNWVLNVVTEIQNRYNIVVLHNNNEIYSSKNKIVSEFNNILLETGDHLFEVYIYGDKFCNCPSILNGYTNTRYFFGWITHQLPQEKPPIKLNVSLPLHIHKDHFELEYSDWIYILSYI
tara:strand:+ start:178 stop:810 length:633 start_codon:yes stop_codon:yes gene_type:complete